MRKTPLVALITIVGLGLVPLGHGCNKESSSPPAKPAGPADSSRTAHAEHAGSGQMESMHEAHREATAASGSSGPTTTRPSAIAQKKCPVLGNPIDPKVFIDYQGRRVYFCCPPCIDKFKAEPAKYLAKLDEEQAAATRPG
jgi:YHS domain-containing protein